MAKQNKDFKNLTYDFRELDEFLTKVINPKELDQYFRGMHTGLTRTLQFLVSIGEGIVFMPEETNVRVLDEMFQILSNMQKGGES